MHYPESPKVTRYYIQITGLAFMNVLLRQASKLAQRCEKFYSLGSRLKFYIAPSHPPDTR